MANEKDQEAQVVRENVGSGPVDLPKIKNLFPDTTGVLLSDKIERYCAEDSRLIYPFDPGNLRPAGYDLTVGSLYAKGEQIFPLKRWGTFEIEPYSVAVIEIHETLNVPEFLIGRWNIRVSLAYEGLLWVGGAQVDPGFQGKLACPIYNLSAKSVYLTGGKPLAMIDFVTTTPFVEGKSRRFEKKNLVFSKYVMGLESGVARQLNHLTTSLQALTNDQQAVLEKMREEITDRQAVLRASIEDKQTSHLEKMEERSSHQDNRIDTFVTLIFTVIAVLFAGLGIVATKGDKDASPFAMPALLAAGALYLSLRAFVISQDRDDVPAVGKTNAISRFFLSSRPIEPVICLSLVLISVLLYYSQSTSRDNALKQQIKTTQSELAAQKADRQKEDQLNKQFRDKSAAQIEALQKQLQTTKPASTPVVPQARDRAVQRATPEALTP